MHPGWPIHQECHQVQVVVTFDEWKDYRTVVAELLGVTAEHAPGTHEEAEPARMEEHYVVGRGAWVSWMLH